MIDTVNRGRGLWTELDEDFGPKEDLLLYFVAIQQKINHLM